MIRLLQVDDDPIFNALFHKHFGQRDDVDLTQVQTVEAAERRIRQAPPVDLLILDLSLPDRDGIEFLNTLKAAGYQGKLVFVSTQPRNVIDMACTLAKSLGVPAELGLSKPLTPGILAQIDDVVSSIS